MTLLYFKKVDNIICIILGKFFEKCTKFKISINPKRCIFMVNQVKMLGHIISKKGLVIEPN